MAQAINISSEITSEDSVAAHALDSLAVNAQNRISKANGFFFDVGEITTLGCSPEQMKLFPFYDFSGGDTEYLAKDGNNSSGFVEKCFRVQVDIWAHFTGNIRLGQDRLLRDFEKYIYDPTYSNIPDKNSPEAIQWGRVAVIEKTRPFGSKVNSPNCGIEIHLILWLGQMRRQPHINS